MSSIISHSCALALSLDDCSTASLPYVKLTAKTEVDAEHEVKRQFPIGHSNHRRSRELLDASFSEKSRSAPPATATATAPHAPFSVLSQNFELTTIIATTTLPYSSPIFTSSSSRWPFQSPSRISRSLSTMSAHSSSRAITLC